MSTARTTVLTFINKFYLSGVVFITSVIMARFLSMPDRLAFQFAGTWTGMGTTFVGGYTQYYAYALSKRPEESDDIVQMGNLFVFALSLIVLGLVFALRNVVFVHVEDKWWWAALCLPLCFIYGYGTRLLQGSNQIKWLNRANAAQPMVLFVMALALFAAQHALSEPMRLLSSYGIWIFSFAVAGFYSLAVSYRLIGKHRNWKWRFNRPTWRGTLDYGGWLSVSNAVNIANYRIDFWLVTAMVPAASASAYGVAVVASEVLVNISTAVASVVFTRMTGGSRSDAIRVTELSSRHTIISSTIVAIGMYILFPWLIWFAYGHRYVGAIIPFLILLPGLIVKAASNIVIQYATNQLGSPKTSIWMNGVSALINAICCLIFLPWLHAVGGAIASTVSYVISYVIYVWWFSRVNRVSPRGLIAIQRTDFNPYLQAVKKVMRRAHAGTPAS